MLVVKNLSVFVGEKQILKHINVVVDKGKIHCLMGPNGSGKSTLAAAIAGIHNSDLRPELRSREFIIQSSNTTEITMDNYSIYSLKPEERAKKGLFLAFQNPVAIPGISVLNFLRIIKKIDKKNLEDIISFNKQTENLAHQLKIDLSLLKRSLNDDFSGGEKKKIEMLQMLTLEPKYAIIDEIDTGLDVDALKIMARAIEKSKQNGTGILFITHNPRILKYLKVDKISILKNGEIVETGGPSLIKKIEEKGFN